MLHRAANSHRSVLSYSGQSSGRLVYSNLDSLPAGGPRSDAGSLVQAVWNSGDYSLELQIEPEFETAEMALVGQVSNRTAPGQALAGAPVRLMASDKQLAGTETNFRGEFCLVSKLRKGLKLCIDIAPADLRVGIPLDKLIASLGR
jgi:hypothetical protein